MARIVKKVDMTQSRLSLLEKMKLNIRRAVLNNVDISVARGEGISKVQIGGISGYLPDI